MAAARSERNGRRTAGDANASAAKSHGNGSAVSLIKDATPSDKPPIANQRVDPRDTACAIVVRPASRKRANQDSVRR